MPLMRCTADGKPGWKYGDAGTCYAYTAGDDASETAARRSAIRQALAIGGGRAPADLGDVIDIDIEALRAALPPREPDETDEAYVERVASDTSTVMPPKETDYLDTEDLVNVPVLRVGGPYHGSGSAPGGDFYDDALISRIAADTRRLVDEYREVKPPNKVGHSAEQKLLRNSGLNLDDDENPAGGWLTNVRAKDGTIYADIKRVPRKLAELIRVGAFRTRSAELRTVTSQTDQKQYRIIAGLGWLGAKAPAVRTLDDIAALYAAELNPDDGAVIWFGEEPPDTVRYVTYEPQEDRRMPPKAADTSSVAKTKLSDEHIDALAKTYEISEDDAAKRRELVEAKLADELAPEKEPEPEPKPEPKFDVPEGTKMLTQVEYDALVAKADAGAAAAEARRIEKRDSLLAQAVSEGRLDPAKVDDWKKHYNDNEGLTTQLLSELPVNDEFLAVYGEDADGLTPETRGQADDDFYMAYVEMVEGGSN